MHCFPLSALTVLCLMSTTASASNLHAPRLMTSCVMTMLDEKEATGEDQGEGNPELEAMGTAIKAAVISGHMTEEEGWALWQTAVSEVKGEEFREGKKQNQKNASEQYDDRNSWHRIGRLVPPDPSEPSMLMEPDFLPRDVQLLNNWLDLDKDRAIIVEMIIRDYMESVKTLTADMQPALRRYKQAEQTRELEEMLQYLEEEMMPRKIDMTEASAVIEERVRGFAEEYVAKELAADGVAREDISDDIDAKTDEWTRDLTSALVTMDEQMSRLRDRMKARVNGVDLPEGQITSRDLLALAESIRMQKANLKKDVIDMLTLALVVEDDAEAQAALNSALSRLRIEHGFRHARMGGEYINPWTLARDFTPEQNDNQPAMRIVKEYEASLAVLVDNRTDATVDRELEGIRMLIARDDLIDIAGDEENVPMETWYEILEPFTESWHAQIDASVNYRDHVLQLTMDTRVALADLDEDLSDRYHDDAMRRGFGSEMRTRWSERALQAALSIDDLDEETLILIEALNDDATDQLRDIRERAIQKRLDRDPELARQPVLSLWDLDDSQGKPWTREDWTGHEMKAHQELNNHVDYSLSAILTPEQYELIPSRGQKNAKAENGKKTKGGKGT